MSKRRTICVDFDGVIADYTKGFQGRGVFGDPLPNTALILNKLRINGWKIIIFTTRSEVDELTKYLAKNQIPYDEINKNSDNPPGTNKGKPIAEVYLDDRALTFTGDWVETYRQILDFKPWFEKE